MTTNRDFEDHGFTIAPSVPSFDFNRNFCSPGVVEGRIR